MGDLRSQLIKAGLVTKKQVEMVEEEKEKSATKRSEEAEKAVLAREFDRKYQFFFGHSKKPQYYFWMRDGKLPPNIENRCCICGKICQSLEESVNNLLTKMSADPLLVNVAHDANEERKKTLSSMSNTFLEVFPALQKIWPAGVPMKSCGGCRDDVVAQIFNR